MTPCRLFVLQDTRKSIDSTVVTWVDISSGKAVYSALPYCTVFLSKVEAKAAMEAFKLNPKYTKIVDETDYITSMAKREL